MRLNPAILGILLLVFCVAAFADLEDVERAQETARNSLIDRFTELAKDKNIMVKVKIPTAGKAKVVEKERKNGDDGLTYKSDLTYHDFSFNTVEKKKDDNGKDKSERLFAFVSPHGGVSKAGGSSVLERKAYELDQRFKKEDEERAKKQDDEKGEKKRSIFKINTQEVTVKEADPNKANSKAEKDRVERFELRDEVKPEIEKVGEESADTLIKASRDKGFENDEETLAARARTSFSAEAATKALYDATAANLAQRNINRGIRGGALGDTPQLSESISNCDEWQKASAVLLADAKGEEKERLQKEISRMTDQCKKLASTKLTDINPRFVEDAKNPDKDNFKSGDDKKEDGFARDLRNQLEIMKKAGKSVKSLPSNWKYEDKDDRARTRIDFIDSEKTVKQQLDEYNTQLKDAAQKVKKKKKTRLPDLQMDSKEILGYEIKPETKSIMEINRVPPQILDEVGLKPTDPTPAAETYEELVQQAR